MCTRGLPSSGPLILKPRNMSNNDFGDFDIFQDHVLITFLHLSFYLSTIEIQMFNK